VCREGEVGGEQNREQWCKNAQDEVGVAGSGGVSWGSLGGGQGNLSERRLPIASVEGGFCPGGVYPNFFEVFCVGPECRW
jgi:hypothetical protein